MVEYCSVYNTLTLSSLLQVRNAFNLPLRNSVRANEQMISFVPNIVLCIECVFWICVVGELNVRTNILPFRMHCVHSYIIYNNELFLFFILLLIFNEKAQLFSCIARVYVYKQQSTSIVKRTLDAHCKVFVIACDSFSIWILNGERIKLSG